MKKFYITHNDNKKFDIINNLKNVLLVIPKKDLSLLKHIKFIEYITLEEFTNNIKFLNFQSKVDKSKSLVILNCLRYNTYNNTKYRKINILGSNSTNTIIIDNFPFIFNECNLFIPLKFLGVEPYHEKQYYDHSFMVELNGEMVKANSFKNIKKLCSEYIEFDNQHYNYKLHEWQCTDEENQKYNDFKHELIYDKDLPKVKVVTWLQGTSNRFKSKFELLKIVIKECKSTKPLVIYNWDKGIKLHKRKIGFISHLNSYHQKTLETKSDILFFETIITQKVKFFDKIKQYSNNNLHLFINNKLGADKIVVSTTVNMLKQLNEFNDVWSK